MGYLCPVCEEPFGDAEACANHLAVTAILHGGPHETWLAEVVDDREAVDGRETATESETADGREAATEFETATESETDDWESVPRAELADLITEHATETTDHDHPGDHTHPVGESHEQTTHDQPAITESRAETAQLDAEAQQILGEARELTRKLQQRDLQGDGERKES